MNLKKTLLSIVLTGITVLGLANKILAEDSIKIANWNLQVFGSNKASNNELMQTYASIIDDYDIIFVQEIRDKSQEAFPKFCYLLPDYNCIISSRAGRTASKEQYGVIYKKDIKIEDFNDFNPDPLDRWERPPIEVTFDINGYDLITYNIHTKPDNAPQEINHLEDVVKTKGNVIILGDLNADCSYYNPFIEDDFDSWTWVIDDNEDTASSLTDCAYDRIILNDDVYEEYVNSGVYKQINLDVSDHYLVWVELATHSPADLNKDGFVDFKDYAIFANNWQKDSNLQDLAIFTDYWLYRP